MKRVSFLSEKHAVKKGKTAAVLKGLCRLSKDLSFIWSCMTSNDRRSSSKSARSSSKGLLHLLIKQCLLTYNVVQLGLVANTMGKIWKRFSTLALQAVFARRQIAREINGDVFYPKAKVNIDAIICG